MRARPAKGPVFIGPGERGAVRRDGSATYSVVKRDMENETKEAILFVDDEESILEIAREFFEHKGYRVFTAGNGREAIEVLNDNRVDCCFTDLNMPEMDGLALAEHLRQKDNTLPVIVMTGYPSLENTIRTLKNGVVDFLIKPVNLNQMELCIKRVLRERDLFVQNVLLEKELESKARIEKLNQELLYKVEELHILNKILSDFAVITSTSDVFKKVVETSLAVVHADEARFFVFNEALNRPFEVAAAATGVEKDGDGAGRGPGGNIHGRSATERLVMEIAGDEIPLLISDSHGARGLPAAIRSHMVVPLKIREKVFGVLTASVLESSRRFSEKDLYYLSFMTQNAANAIENLALYENIYQNLFSTLYAFVRALEARDPYTQQHSNRVTGISMIIGREMGCSAEELDVLNFAGHLHDIGKIGIRDDILLKPGALTREEFEKIKEHPVIGARIVEQLGLWDREKKIIRCHHERFDGSGYPDGIAGEEIPLLARILSVADVYDAVASDRAYRKKMPEDQILSIIEEGAGGQFDPRVVEAFLRLYQNGKVLENLDHETFPAYMNQLETADGQSPSGPHL